MPKFRKKPVVIEATRLKSEVRIATREGELTGKPGDWLITGVQGEVYPCGDSIFRQTYEPADEEAEAAFKVTSGSMPCRCPCED